jgi:hypothetical protein
MAANVKEYAVPCKLEFNGHRIGITVTEWAVYLCPDCDLTHIEIMTVGGGIIFRCAATPELAEEIGKAMINPPAASIDELFK